MVDWRRDDAVAVSEDRKRLMERFDLSKETVAVRDVDSGDVSLDDREAVKGVDHVRDSVGS